MSEDGGCPVRWYYTIVGSSSSDASSSSLFANESVTPNRSFVVCRDEEKRSKPAVADSSSGGLLPLQTFSKVSAVFDSYLYFYAWMEKHVPRVSRHFYEVIVRGALQKPYFDIDNSVKISSAGDAKKTISDFEKSVVKLAKRLKRAATDDGCGDSVSYLIFSSNGEETKETQSAVASATIKLSYHIVLDGIFCVSHTENRELCSYVLTKFGEESSSTSDKTVFKTVDMCLYKSLQQFRLVGSKKIGTSRTKIFRADLSDENFVQKKLRNCPPKLLDLRIFSASLVSFTTESRALSKSCEFSKSARERKTVAAVMTPNGLVPRGYNGMSETTASVYFLTTDEAHSVVDYVKSYIRKKTGEAVFGLEMKNPVGPFASSPEHGNPVLLDLKRTCASYCCICNRTHYSEGSFITFRRRGGKIKFECRRNQAQLPELVAPCLRLVFTDLVDRGGENETESVGSSSDSETDSVFESDFYHYSPPSTPVPPPPTPVPLPPTPVVVAVQKSTPELRTIAPVGNRKTAATPHQFQKPVNPRKKLQK